MKDYVKAVLVIVGITLVVGIFMYGGLVGKNNVQNFQVIQPLNGEVKIQSTGGYYVKFFPTVWTYPKMRNVFFSRDTREGSPIDESIKVTFKNKGTGSISTRVTYKLFNSKEEIKKLHENTGADIEIADGLVLSKLKKLFYFRLRSLKE